MLLEVKLWMVGLLSVLGAGCAQIPTHELSQYRAAFAEVQTTSETILIDFAEAKQAAEKSAAAAAEPPQKVLFPTDLEYDGSKQLDAVEVRRTALRTIDKFNNVLTTLAEGKSIEAVQNTAGGFVAAANKFVDSALSNAVPGLSALTNGIKTLMGEMEKARLRKEFEKALQKGGPIIDKMLVELLADRVDHINLRAVEANDRHVEVLNEITSQAAAVRALVRQHGTPATEDPLPLIQAGLNDALKPAEKTLAFPLPIELSYDDAKPPFDEEQRLIATQTIAQIVGQVGALNANIEQFERLKSALNNYGAMIQRTQISLATLAEALDKPQKFEDASEQLFQIAFSVKQDVEAFKAARKAGK